MADNNKIDFSFLPDKQGNSGTQKLDFSFLPDSPNPSGASPVPAASNTPASQEAAGFLKSVDNFLGISDRLRTIDKFKTEDGERGIIGDLADTASAVRQAALEGSRERFGIEADQPVLPLRQMLDSVLPDKLSNIPGS